MILIVSKRQMRVWIVFLRICISYLYLFPIILHVAPHFLHSLFIQSICSLVNYSLFRIKIPSCVETLKKICYCLLLNVNTKEAVLKVSSTKSAKAVQILIGNLVLALNVTFKRTWTTSLRPVTVVDAIGVPGEKHKSAIGKLSIQVN